MNNLIISLLVIHLAAAAAWVGGSTMLELVIEPTINDFPRVQASLVSTRIERRYTNLAWISLGTITVTGVLMSIIQGTFNFTTMFHGIGLFLLVSIILTAAAIVNGFLINFYFTPKLLSGKYPELNLRGIIKTLVRSNNLMGLIAIVLMVIFTEVPLLPV